MRNLFVTLILAGGPLAAIPQTTFIIDSIKDPGISSLYDIQLANEIYYCIGNQTNPVSPWQTSSTLYISDSSGNIIDQRPLGNPGIQYFQILSIKNDTLLLAGSEERDSCSAVLLISNYIIGSGNLSHITEYNFCKGDKIIKRMKLVKGLDVELFIEGDYGHRISNNYANRTFVAKLGTSNELSIVFDSAAHFGHFGIDFSQKGYVLKDVYLCNFYTRNFEYRKQRYDFVHDFESESNIHFPFSHGYLLDQVIKVDGDPRGQAVRLLDSNLRLKKLAVISPYPFGINLVSLIRNGGLDFADENSIWTTTNLGYYFGFSNASNFSITKLDSELNIICTHFFGFDGHYQIHGIRALKDNGAIVFGSHLSDYGMQLIGDEEIYAFKIGNDCEITATDPPDESLFSLSVFPNPGNDNITISSQGFDLTTLLVELLDEGGKMVYRMQDLNQELYLHDLPAGQYFYRILQKEKLLGVGSWVKQ